MISYQGCFFQNIIYGIQAVVANDVNHLCKCLRKVEEAEQNMFSVLKRMHGKLNLNL